MNHGSPRKIRLAHDERIVAVVPQRAGGPGWANAPTWVHIVNREGRWREECIQPEERTVQMHALYSISAQVHADLLSAVPIIKGRPPKEQ